MNLIILTRQVMNILTSVMPYLSGGSAETSISKKNNENAYNQGKKLYEAIRERFTREHDDKASSVLQAFVNDVDLYSSAVEVRLVRLVKEDPTFAETLSQIILASPRQVLTIGEESQVRMIQMTNKMGMGTQEIRATEKSVVEENQMRIE